VPMIINPEQEEQLIDVCKNASREIFGYDNNWGYLYDAAVKAMEPPPFPESFFFNLCKCCGMDLGQSSPIVRMCQLCYNIQGRVNAAFTQRARDPFRIYIEDN